MRDAHHGAPRVRPEPRWEQRLSNQAVPYLLIIGAWLLLGPLPFVRDYCGYGWMEDFLGGPGPLVRFFVAFLFLYFAGMVKEKNDLRAFLGQLVAGHRAESQPTDQRAAVDILIAALKSDRSETRQLALENLKRLTGQNLGPEPGPWQAWRDRLG